MKLWAMPCRAIQDGWVVVESSDKTWSTGEGNGKPLQYLCLENPMISKKRQKDMTLKDELLRSVGAQYATGEELRKNSRKNEEERLSFIPRESMFPGFTVSIFVPLFSRSDSPKINADRWKRHKRRGTKGREQCSSPTGRCKWGCSVD